ncbi:MAG TPA: serine/threonine-protein kinase [Kofleriaceae bacterium]|nr:serine/threonine-protein kinase [Kofleriaceae bacterium]
MSHEGLLATTPVKLGAYELIRPIAQGGMADVYLARQEGPGGFERQVAIKILSEARARDPESRALFLQEARICALLGHHNIAAVLDVDVEDGCHYLAMEYVDGVDLRDLLAAAARADRGVPYEVTLSIITAAAAGLDHAHRRCDAAGRPLRLVHRDVSLSNIMVAKDGAVKVVDFGIASTAISDVHTLPGVVRGKASYMSPEQCMGDPLDHRTDVFALGVVLYELTTGARCFHGRTDFERMLAVVRGDYLPPAQLVPNYPPELERVIRTALAPAPEDRFASCAEMIEALEAVAAARGWRIGTQPIARFMAEVSHAPAGLCDACAAAGEATTVEPVIAPDIEPAVEPAVEPVIEPAVTTRLPARPRTRAQWRDDDDDDALTRGRRALKRPATAPRLAA